MVFDGRRIRRAEIPVVPVGDLLLRSVRIQQQHLGMIFRHVALGLSGQRGPPKLRAKALGVDLVHQRLHIAIAIGKLGRQQRPVPFVGLPAVIHPYPREAEFLDHGQRLLNLDWRERFSVAPGAPDGAERAFRRGIEFDAALLHRRAIVFQALKIIALMDRREAL